MLDEDIARKLKIVFSKYFDSFTNLNKVNFSSAVPYGNFYLIHSICEKLSLFQTFTNQFTALNCHVSVETAVQYIKAMVFKKMINPDNKITFIDWYSHTSLRYFTSIEKELNLETLHQSLNVLNANLKVVENELQSIDSSIFKQIHKELFYDITNIYLEEQARSYTYICVLAHFMMMEIENTSKHSSIKLSGRKILRKLSHIHLLEINMPKGEKMYSLTKIEKEDNKILNAFGITKIKLPDEVM